MACKISNKIWVYHQSYEYYIPFYVSSWYAEKSLREKVLEKRSPAIKYLDKKTSE